MRGGYEFRSLNATLVEVVKVPYPLRQEFTMPPIKPASLARLSRDRSFLIRASLVLSAAAIVVAFAVSLISPPPREIEAEIGMLKALIDRTDEESRQRSFEEWTHFLRTGIPASKPDPLRDCRRISTEPETGSGEPIEPEGLPDLQAEMLHFLDLGLRLGDPESAVTGLLSLPSAEPFRNEFLGDIEFVRGHHHEARDHYLAELFQRPDSSYSRRSAVVSAWRSGERESLRELLANADLREEFSPPEQLDLFTDARDFRGLAGAVVRYEWSEFLSPSLIPALFTATIWILILMPFWTVTRQRILLSIVAFAAGILSAGLTIFLVMIQERMQGFTHQLDASPLNQVLYFIAGVALREESLKLLCFLPLGIWAARKGRYLDGLILASLVGLGFAFKENILYFDGGSVSFTALIRFLTANVLHFSLTGIAGYYLVRMLHRKFHGLETFLFCFIAVVVAHGMYNAVIAVPALASYSPLATIFVAAMGYQFFDPLRSHMEAQGMATRVSPLGVFVIGCALIAGGLMIASAFTSPFRIALGVFASSVGGLIPLAFAYISRFRDL